MNEQLLNTLQNNPEAQQAIDESVNKLIQDPDVTAEAVDQMIKMFEYVLQNPQSYPQLREQAIQDGNLDETDLPPEFDESVVEMIVVTLKILKQRMADAAPGGQMQQQGMPQQMQQQGAPVPGFANGGLNQIAAAGRRGDTQLAHINPFEAEILRSYGGSGTINPETGLPEFGFFSSLWKGVKSVAKVVVPVAAAFVAPYLAPFLGGSMLAAGAVAGGLGSALTGGNILQGAALGGLGNGLGSIVGGAANTALGTGLSQAGQATLGGGLIGGAMGALNGQGVLQGAATGALGQYVGGQAGAAGGAMGGTLGQGVSSGMSQFGNMLTAGYDPKTALAGGALSGLAAGITRPSQSVVDNYKTKELGSGLTGPTNPDYSLSNVGTTSTELGSGLKLPGSTQMTPTSNSFNTAGTPTEGFGLNFNTALKAVPLLSALSGTATQEQPKEAVQQLSPQQQEYFNRPSVMWDWDKMKQDADTAGLGLGRYMAQNWRQVSSGAYNQPTSPVKMAQGGLSQLAYAVGGAGSGREDKIDAKLSDGEYVMDAETVAMLGDGSGKEGARRLDEMRASLRAHKGKKLSKGQISPDAKSPLAYLKGAM